MGLSGSACHPLIHKLKFIIITNSSRYPLYLTLFNYPLYLIENSVRVLLNPCGYLLHVYLTIFLSLTKYFTYSGEVNPNFTMKSTIKREKINMY